MKINDLFNVENKVAIVTGGSRGIGKEISELLSKENIVFSTSRNELNESNQNIRQIKYDVLEDELDPRLLPNQIDGFVYCPGTINLRPFRSLKLETFRSDLELNLIGAIKTLQLILPKLQQQCYKKLYLRKDFAEV